MTRPEASWPRGKISSLRVCAAVSYGFDHEYHDHIPLGGSDGVCLSRECSTSPTYDFPLRSCAVSRNSRETNRAPRELNVRVRTAGTSTDKHVKADPVPHDGRGVARSSVRADAQTPSPGDRVGRRCGIDPLGGLEISRNGNDARRGRPDAWRIATV